MDFFLFLDDIKNLKPLWSKGSTHKIWVKSETKIFLIFKGGTLWCLLIFKVSMFRSWSPLTDRNGRTDSPKCWNSGVSRCSNIKNFIWEQVLGIKRYNLVDDNSIKIDMGHYGPCPCDNVIPEPVWNRVKRERIFILY